MIDLVPPQFLGTNSHKKKGEIQRPVATRVCDCWRWQRMLAVEACRVTWRRHQLWWPRAETQSVQRQHVWTLWPARHPALQPRHSRRGRSRRNPWTTTTTTQGLTTTPRACIRPHVPARAGWRSYVRNRVCGGTQCRRLPATDMLLAQVTSATTPAAADDIEQAI